jgi:hypothetical protein
VHARVEPCRRHVTELRHPHRRVDHRSDSRPTIAAQTTALARTSDGPSSPSSGLRMITYAWVATHVKLAEMTSGRMLIALCSLAWVWLLVRLQWSRGRVASYRRTYAPQTSDRHQEPAHRGSKEDEGGGAYDQGHRRGRSYPLQHRLRLGRRHPVPDQTAQRTKHIIGTTCSRQIRKPRLGSTRDRDRPPADPRDSPPRPNVVSYRCCHTLPDGPGSTRSPSTAQSHGYRGPGPHLRNQVPAGFSSAGPHQPAWLMAVGYWAQPQGGTFGTPDRPPTRVMHSGIRMKEE